MTSRGPRSVVFAALLSWGCTGSIDGPEGSGRIDDQGRPLGPAGGQPTSPGGTPTSPIGTPATPGSGGATGQPGPPAVPSTAMIRTCPTPDVAPSAVRRLTRFEYNNTVRDLLGDSSNPADAFPAEERLGTFDNAAGTLTVSDLLAESYYRAAQTVAARATEALPALLACDTAKEGEDLCAQRFIDRFGARAYRRPLEPDERTRLLALYMSGKTQLGFKTGIEAVIQGVLQAPQFLYRLEGGTPIAAGSPVLQAGPYEIASRLSYLLWGSMPDEPLLMAAQAGQLGTRQGIATAAGRLIADGRTREVVLHLHRQLLSLGGISKLEKDKAVFPSFSPEIAGLMQQEAERYVTAAAFETGHIGDLWNGRFTFVEEKLARYYGIPNVTGTMLRRVTPNAMQRAGIFTQGGLMALEAKPNASHPIARGVYVLKTFLCAEPPAPPANIDTSEKPGVTAQQASQSRLSNSACMGCHTIIDPVGFGFENFNGVGLWRTMDGNQPITSAGNLPVTDAAGPFGSPVELMDRIAASKDARRCLARHWFTFTYGRAPGQNDQCALGQIEDWALNSAKLDAKELLVLLTQTDAFLHRRAAP